jgi:hypothetical protein
VAKYDEALSLIMRWMLMVMPMRRKKDLKRIGFSCKEVSSAGRDLFQASEIQ